MSLKLVLKVDTSALLLSFRPEKRTVISSFVEYGGIFIWFVGFYCDCFGDIFKDMN